jgi:hypothetical protein
MKAEATGKGQTLRSKRNGGGVETGLSVVAATPQAALDSVKLTIRASG